MQRKRGNLLLVFGIVAVVLLVVSSCKNENKEQYLSWENSKEQFIAKYTFVQDIAVDGTGPTLIINVKMKKQTELDEIENAFNEIRSQPIEVYQDLEKMHQKKHGGISKMSICFYTDQNNRDSAYIFTTFKDKSDTPGFEGFSNWTLEHNGETKDL